MPVRNVPPFRADHVGSFLRPVYLLEARDRHARGEIDAAALRAVEDRAIAEIVRFQEDIGLKSVTDGEFRRTYFHLDSLRQLDGVSTDDPKVVTGPDGKEHLAPPSIRVTGKARHARDSQPPEFERLPRQVPGGRTPTPHVPSPSIKQF